ncbi:hypothetical protein [Rhodobacter capsulatus]|nr:hypothetical protein [Rhodobacter capsulatus]
MFKVILVLLLAAVLGTLGYAYFGDMTADPVEIRSPVALPDLAPAAAVPAAAVSPASPASPAPQAAAQPAPATEAAGAGLDD